ncbi:HWE histidine kinase domain-containing protein [Starkeya sp. ORNL1]|uniref:sensor histidine kinase n=1 Tax=Starkeya sp. ORNL1 TaxID=2709380 RepID=UPI00197EEAF0|nr:HWE histidine kinase domain-containing protein [Starkeya sp. ORNL1]
MRSVLAASDDCIKVLSLDGDLIFMSEGGQRVMEISDFNDVKGCPWPDFWEGQGNGEARQAIEAARGGRSSRFQAGANTAKGNARWWDVQVSPILDADGNPESILSVSRDITAMKLAEERQHLLSLELQHRNKNTIAMVQALASQTFATAETLPQAGAILLDRLRSLSSAQDLLVQTAFLRANLPDLITGALKPHNESGRISISGPDIEMSSKCALAVSLAVHELATNATKYGALSNRVGTVTVRWSISDSPAMFLFEWLESGGPPVLASPAKPGFGSRLIERALAGYLGGTAKIDYRPGGVEFALQAPLAAIVSD